MLYTGHGDGVDRGIDFGYIVLDFFMITHYFTLLALRKEFRTALHDCTVGEIFTHQKNELWISFNRKAYDSQGNQHPSVCISVDPQFNFCFLRNDVTRAKKNSVDLFHLLNHVSLEEVTVASYDRILSFQFTNSLILNALLYNTSGSNVLLVDSSNVILEAFKNNKRLQGTPHQPDTGKFNKQCLNDEGLFAQSMTAVASISVASALRQSIPFLGSITAREILHRAGINENMTIAQIAAADVSAIHRHLREIITETEAPSPAIYIRPNGTRVFSVIRLLHISGGPTETFRSVNDGIRSFVVQTFRSEGFEAEKKHLESKLRREHDRLQRSLGQITNELHGGERAEQYERFGNILIANLYRITKGLSNIDLPDILDNHSLVRISLNPKLTPAENAERYFVKAKKSKVSRSEAEHRQARMQRNVETLQRLLQKLHACETLDQIKEFKKSQEHALKSIKLIQREPENGPLPFRIFTVAEGHEVWVGKSGAGNDQLTMKYAKPNDLWFHVRGASGSHTVLKVAGKTAPSKEAIRQAASIAAYYSKMRKAGNVPVAYCERKYVRKPKRASEGSVIMEREKVIFVSPQLPPNLPFNENS